jgi:hypothetical protein
MAAAVAQSRQRDTIAGICQGQKKQESGPEQDKAAEHQVDLAGKHSRPDGTQRYAAAAAADEIGREVEQSPNANLVATFHGGSFVHFMDKVGFPAHHALQADFLHTEINVARSHVISSASTLIHHVPPPTALLSGLSHESNRWRHAVLQAGGALSSHVPGCVT